MDVIKVSDKLRWDEAISSFNTQNIYYNRDYIRSLLVNDDSEGVLFYFNDGISSMCYPMLIKDIAKDTRFKGSIMEGVYFDMETPYGYGGPLYDIITEKGLKIFREELASWCSKNNIVSQFIRFNPILGNVIHTAPFFDDTRYLHHTVYIDTSSKEMVVKNMTSKNRNMVRKAIKNGVEIVFDQELRFIEDFKKIYKVTMDYHNASGMYYFPDNYYSFLKDEFIDHTILARALYKGKTISSALFFYDNQHMHYHLSGTLLEYRNLASVNLMLYEAACWAADRGVHLLHLGGGLEENDSLFGFKKQFNKNGYVDFWIGKTVFICDKYEQLLDTRKKLDVKFNKNNHMMIQYRG